MTEANTPTLGASIVPFESALHASAVSLSLSQLPLLIRIFQDTNRYWNEWIRRSTYNGSWKEAVHRSALALKLLIYEPTGAVIASPTFSLPEYIGGARNWYI